MSRRMVLGSNGGSQSWADTIGPPDAIRPHFGMSFFFIFEAEIFCKSTSVDTSDEIPDHTA